MLSCLVLSPLLRHPYLGCDGLERQALTVLGRSAAIGIPVPMLGLREGIKSQNFTATARSQDTSLVLTFSIYASPSTTFCGGVCIYLRNQKFAAAHYRLLFYLD